MSRAVRRDAEVARVLLVDDAESVRAYLVDLLEARGYEVDTAADGNSALALIEGGADPDVVLLDVRMPEKDGMETLEAIRALSPELPVVMLSVEGRASTIATKVPFFILTSHNYRRSILRFLNRIKTKRQQFW